MYIEYDKRAYIDILFSPNCMAGKGGFTWTCSTQTFILPNRISIWIHLTQLSSRNHPSLSSFGNTAPQQSVKTRISPQMWRYTRAWAWGCFLQKSHIWVRLSLQHPSAWARRSPPSTAHSTAVLRRTEAAYIITGHFPQSMSNRVGVLSDHHLHTHSHSIRLAVLLALNYCTANRHNKRQSAKIGGGERRRTLHTSPVNTEGDPAVP